MYLLKPNRICFSRLYNNKFKTKIGFFSPSKTFNEVRTDYSKLTVQNSIDSDGNLKNSNIINYGIFVPKDSLKLELLNRKQIKLSNRQKCSFSISTFHNHLFRIQRFPKNKAYVTQFKRWFRRGSNILLLSDNVFAKIPKVHMIIHYDLPGTLDIFAKRLAPTKCNLFFYGKTDKLFMAQLHNYLKVVIEDWTLPSTKSVVESFLNQLEEIFTGKNEIANECSPDTEQLEINEEVSKTEIYLPEEENQNLKKELSTVDSKIKILENFDKKSLLASLLYMIHNKFKDNKIRQYLIYDPKFKLFKTREMLIKYLKDNEVPYSSVNLSKNGFVVESLSEISLPISTPVMKYKKFTTHINKLRKLIRKSYLSSALGRRYHTSTLVSFILRKYFKKLVKDHERRIINKLKL
uniref:Uncharacterized protein n=1 Tax=Theileria annulata TaxID=5874 RepID=A0A3B0N6Y0_THEAN